MKHPNQFRVCVPRVVPRMMKRIFCGKCGRITAHEGQRCEECPGKTAR